jgi:hypothetical protein
MPSPKAARTTRRFLKLASLGLAGLLAGLLAGCSSSAKPINLAIQTQPSTLEMNSSAFTLTHQPYTHPVPDLRHPPAPHRIESWADRTPRQASVFPVQIDDSPTLTNYAFTNAPSSSNSGPSHLTVQ